MLRALTKKDALGRPTLVLGLTDDNWRRLQEKDMYFDASDIGLPIKVVIFRAGDGHELKAKAVELGIADPSLLDLPEATPIEAQLWEPEE